ncbi:MAG: hypothetical protein ACYDHF_00825 [Candidatus Cryosericum sp.]
MNKKTIVVLSIALAAVIGFGALLAVPTVRADTVATTQVSTADKTAISARISTLRGLYQQIRKAADDVRAKVKAAKSTGADLTAFKEDIKTVLKGGKHLRIDVSKLRRIKLTELQRSQLKSAQTSIDAVKKQIRQAIESKLPQGQIDVLKASLKAAIAARDALIKSFRVTTGTRILGQLDNMIAEALKELTALHTLLARLP